MTFTVLGEPVGKARPRVVRNGNHVHTYTPEKTVTYERQVQREYIRQGGQNLGKTPLSLSVVARFAVPKSDSKQKRQQKLDGIIQPTKKPDTDNVLKIIADALNGIAYDDDSQIIRAEVVKVYAEEPSVEITITPLGR